MRISDWSSDVCSSDLKLILQEAAWSPCSLLQDQLVGREERGSAPSGICRGSLRLRRRQASANDGWLSSRSSEIRTRQSAVSQATRRRMLWPAATSRSEEHTSELQSLMRISYAVFCLKKKKT